ncbi:NAD-dependent succinate-semialdehyde dehydrogenase [Prosthecomicrobium hirschii]|uniref:NAD-dependent succinate-semialdehyde dehydrogenase n=1 Tax=Prosthecodimorpha hirschii TaxID=665126 RepID=UPI0022204940|nr:NAD-dependent succinate-semialdehyde dehydrogenase [Prosthecomicrobium hirschii]MCW1843903.1 NAD-dependent succinate-semialdehyde dehydrogenase [Prosthecomicrobium hirschii]
MLKKTNPFLREANLIGGAWVGADSGAVIEVNNPATGEIIGTVPNAGRAETRRAIAAAHAAMPAWAAKTAAERAAIMHRLAGLIRENLDGLAELLTLEQGKSLAEAKGEVLGSAAYVQWFAEEARRVYGDVIPSPWGNRKILVMKEPVGVAACITPWNFPSSMISRKVGAALAAGCSVVVKPADLTPYSGLAWGVLAAEAGVPDGVVNIVTGTAAPIGDEFIDNPLVRKLTFTGSTAVGKMLASRAVANMKRVSMELGGNAPFIVFDDADIDRAAEQAVLSKFRNSGQTCVCTNRFYVQAGVYEEFAAKFAKAVQALKVGNGLEAGVAQGPLINAAAIAKVEAHVADALAKGASVVTGGGRHDLGGTFFTPTVLRDATPDMRIATEETFGPVAPMFRFETEAEAIGLANATDFGLAGYFFTRDLARAFRVAAALKFGQVGINEGLLTTEVAPFGGVKDSGLGREGSKYGLDDYLDIKYVCVGGL